MKFYSIIVVDAKSIKQARKKVENNDFQEEHVLFDRIVTKTEIVKYALAGLFD